MPLLPNLVIPGAPKSATSSLCKYLSQHSEVFVPKQKEPRFFIADIIKRLPDSDSIKQSLLGTSTLTLDKYKCLYKEGEQAKYSCDASVQYLFYHDSVIPKIKTILGDPTIIIVLRNPVLRAFSNFVYVRNETVSSFEEGLALESEREKMHWNSFWLYKKQGFYYEQVKHFLSSFSKVKVMIMEDFKTSAAMPDIFEFLELNPVAVDTEIIHNKSGNPKNKLVEWLFFKNNFIKQSFKPVINTIWGDRDRRRLSRSIKDKLLAKTNSEMMNPDTYNKLVDTYHQDILRLQDLIKRDLSHWIKMK